MKTTIPPVEIGEAMGFLLDPPLGDVRYRVAYGGRGAIKSWSVARVLLLLGAETSLRILCAREYQSSIRESVHQLLSDQIHMIGFSSLFEVQRTTIRGTENGTEFIFAGIKRDPHKLKSIEGVDICWIEEAEAVSAESWAILRPTIRKDGSEIWVTFNPGLATDPTWQLFIENPPARSIVRKVGFLDNPFLPAVLREEAEELRRRDPEAFSYIWGGNPWERSDSEVLAGKWRIGDFEPLEHWTGPYFGADWGFANDPTVLLKMWVADSRLWIEYDERGVGLGMDEIARAWDRVPDSRRYTIRADNSRPETIHELKARGFRVIGAPKWKGSVEDGTAFLRNFEEIVIHPRCKGWAQEARLWRYKTDSRTGDVLPRLQDGHDHGPDAARYGLAPLIQKRPSPRVWFPGMDGASPKPDPVA